MAMSVFLSMQLQLTKANFLHFCRINAAVFFHTASPLLKLINL